MLEAQRFKWEEAFHRYAVGQQLYMHTKWCSEKAHIYVRTYTYTFFAANVTHTHEHADSTDTLAINSKINYNDLELLRSFMSEIT